MQYWEQHQGQSKLPEAEPSQIFRVLYSAPAHGIYASAMVRYFQQNGYRAFAFTGEWADIERELQNGRPLIAALKPGSGSVASLRCRRGPRRAATTRPRQRSRTAQAARARADRNSIANGKQPATGLCSPFRRQRPVEPPTAVDHGRCPTLQHSCSARPIHFTATSLRAEPAAARGRAALARYRSSAGTVHLALGQPGLLSWNCAGAPRPLS